MPRQRDITPTGKVVIPTTSLVASATRYPGKAARIFIQTREWQKECYRHYAICGEARYAAQYFGHALSRANLYIAKPGVNGPERQTTGPAVDRLAELFAGRDGQIQMLQAIGVHLTIAGECYLVGRSTEFSDSDVWEIVSVMEMVTEGDRWSIRQGQGLPNISLSEDDVVIRIWLPDPSMRTEADSPFKSLLPILREIEFLTRHVFAQVQSRLTGAGVWFLPKGMTFPPAPDQPNSDGNVVTPANEADAFMLTLADATLTSIQKPGSPSEVVPIVVTVDDEVLQNIDQGKLIHFWSDLDANAKELREEAIQRFALGIDLPPEAVLGMGSNAGSAGGNSNGVSHWGAWQIEEQTIKLHVEPMGDAVVNALTVAYLRPLLPDGALEQILADYMGLRLRPDRSKEAFELFDRGELSALALRRETGFSEDDKPDEDEYHRWLTVKIASGSATPEQVQAALSLLGVDLPVDPIPTTRRETITDRVPELPPSPSLEDHPTRPRTPDPLLAACDALVFRALERAGNRLRQISGSKPACASYETHLHIEANGTTERALEDAWACAPQILDGLTEKPKQVVTALNVYTGRLLAGQLPHTRAQLESFLREGLFL